MKEKILYIHEIIKRFLLLLICIIPIINIIYGTLVIIVIDEYIDNFYLSLFTGYLSIIIFIIEIIYFINLTQGIT